MPIIDSQVHCYERNHAGRPWAGVLHGPPEVTGRDMVAAMDRVGVDGALLISPYAMYRFDGSYAIEVHKAHPGRFALIKPVDPASPSVGDVISEWKGIPGTVGVRIMLNQVAATDPADPGLDRVLAASRQHGLPVNILAWGRLDQFAGLARRHPDTAIVLDHCGLKQPFEPPVPQDGFADVPKVAALATLPNVSIKISGACTLSQQGYPYDDIWDPVCRLVDAFGLDRCLWGTDWTRAFAVVNYEQAVRPFVETKRLSGSERAMLMGGACAKAYRWEPRKA